MQAVWVPYEGLLKEYAGREKEVLAGLTGEHKDNEEQQLQRTEADVLAGPLLSRKAQEAGIIYSMAYGDQPALIAEMVDWARTAGL